MTPGKIEYSDGRFFKVIEGETAHKGTLAGKEVTIEDNLNEKDGLYIFRKDVRERLLPGESIDLDSGKCVIAKGRDWTFKGS